MNMTFTKRDTLIAKGMAILLVFAHHLFAFKDRLQPGNGYIPLLLYVNLEYYVGMFGKISVALFLFLTGYGLTLSLRDSGRPLCRYILGKIWRFYGTYWLYFAFFIPIGLLYYRDVTQWQSFAPRFVADPATILLNFLGLSYSFNDEWWFVRLYLEVLLFVFPLFHWLHKQGVAHVIIASALLYGVSYFWDTPNHLFFWQGSVAMGILLATEGSQLFESINGNLANTGASLLFLVTVVGILLRFRTTAADDLVLGPLFALTTVHLVKKIRLDRAVAFLGRYAMQLWLTHSFFSYYYAQDLVFWPRYAPLVFAMLIALSLSSVLLIEAVRSAVVQRLIPEQRPSLQL